MTDFLFPRGADIVALHDRTVSDEAWAGSEPTQFESDIWRYIELNHHHNCRLWAEEDQARRKNVADSEIAANKRAIDKHNQARNDAIERIDAILLSTIARVTLATDARLNSETAGSMVDRMSIVSLKIYHMGLQTRRIDADETHRETCRQKVVRLNEQRGDLIACFDHLLAQASEGQVYFKVYRQFKMYNDPNLNPYLYSPKH